MGKTAKVEITYNDWSGGDWGVLDPLTVARENLPMFKGNNVQVYRNGSVGPRPGFKEFLISGTRPTSEHESMHFGYSEIPTTKLIDITLDINTLGTGMYHVNPSTFSAQTMNFNPPAVGYAFVPNPPPNLTQLNSSELLSGVQVWDGSSIVRTVTVAGNTGIRPSRNIRYRDRMYYFGYGAPIYYSNPGAYETIPASNVFFLEQSNLIFDAFVFKNTLYLLAINGSRGASVYALTGASPATGTLTEITKYVPIWGPQIFGVGTSEVIGSSSVDGRVWVFNGTTFEFLEHIRGNPNHPLGAFGHQNTQGPNLWDYKHLYIHGPDSFILPYRSLDESSGTPQRRTFGLWERVNGVWCVSTIPGSTLKGIRGLATDDKFIFMKWAQNDPQSTTSHYLTREPTLDRPGSATDAWATEVDNFPDMPYDNAAKPYVSIPPVVAPDGAKGVQIAKIIVDLDYWADGTRYAGAPEIWCTIDLHGMWKEPFGSPVNTFITGAMSESPATWPASFRFTPRRRRVAFTFPQHPAASSIGIQFNTLRNVAIHRVYVLADMDQSIFPGGM